MLFGLTSPFLPVRKTRVNTLLVKKPSGKKAAKKETYTPKNKDSLLFVNTGLRIKPGVDLTKPTCPHWN